MRAKLNIVVVTDTCEVDGGAALVALEDARLLARNGHRVIFFSACGQPPEGRSDIEWISLGQKAILEEPQRWKAALYGLWNLRTARALKNLLDSLPRERSVVHVHSWSKALSGSAISAVHARGFRMVSTLHEYFVVCPNGGLYDYPTQKVCSLQPMSFSCVTRNCDSRIYAHKIWRVLRQWIWRYLAGIPSNFDRMITVSKFSANKISERLGHAPVSVIENLPTLEQQLLVPIEKRTSAIYAGRVSAEKGVDSYLMACHIAGVKAEICGDGPLLPELKVKWPQAHFTGWLPKQKMAERLKEALVLVVPSLWYENSPMIIAEAAASGVAVIVSDHGAAATLIEDGVTGLHFRGGDAADLAEKIARLNLDPQLAYSMGQTAYNRFWQGYEERRRLRIEKIETCYRELLGIAA